MVQAERVFRDVDDDSLRGNADLPDHRSPFGLGAHLGLESGLASGRYHWCVKDLSFRGSVSI